MTRKYKLRLPHLFVYRVNTRDVDAADEKINIHARNIMTFSKANKIICYVGVSIKTGFSTSDHPSGDCIQ